MTRVNSIECWGAHNIDAGLFYKNSILGILQHMIPKGCKRLPEDFEWRKEVAGTIERPATMEGETLYYDDGPKSCFSNKILDRKKTTQSSFSVAIEDCDIMMTVQNLAFPTRF